MAEDLQIITGSKQQKYLNIIPQIKALLLDEDDSIANMGNLCAALKEQFDWLWIGFYILKKEELVLGPFQGPVACTRISKGKGVCGSAWSQATTLIVPDVEVFPGHIACSSLSKSELVIPLFRNGIFYGVFDVDSVALHTFDDTDAEYLTEILSLLHFKVKP